MAEQKTKDTVKTSVSTNGEEEVKFEPIKQIETDTFDAVKGSVSGNELTIVSENSSSVADVSWMVVGDRKDVDYDVEELKVEGLDADTKASILAAIEEASNE